MQSKFELLVANAKRGKTCANLSRLALVILLGRVVQSPIKLTQD